MTHWKTDEGIVENSGVIAWQPLPEPYHPNGEREAMKCINCNNAGKCLDHKEQPSLIGYTSGIPQRKKQTNADRIHSMNIEETAELLYSFYNLEDKVKFCKNKTECEEILDSGKEIPGDMCKKCLAEWLQSEVEV